MSLYGQEVVRGESVVAEVLYSNTGLSFWGGVDPLTGNVIDIHHPLHGQCIAGKVLVLPGGRGSCTGSQCVLELLLNKKAPAAIITKQADEILALGVFVAEEIFSVSFPMVNLPPESFESLATARYAVVQNHIVHAGANRELVEGAAADTRHSKASMSPDTSHTVHLTTEDQAVLAGERGEAAQIAMRTVVRVAQTQRADRLIDVSQAHIDACTYIGPGGLRFAQRLVELGGKFRVPTTLNSLSLDRQRWRELGIPATLAEPAGQLADAYLALGAQPSYTCAPYLLDSAPKLGDQVVWGESNAVVYANSALGARTQKYADYLDVCAAIVGRAPSWGCHTSRQRHATVRVHLPTEILKGRVPEDSFWPVFGYLVGLKAAAHVPVVTGVEARIMNADAFKSFSAAFGTTATAAMFHVVGNTPEAPDLSAADDVPVVNLSADDFVSAWSALDSGADASDPTADEIQLVSLGNPHLSLTECKTLSRLVDGAAGARVRVIATMGRHVLDEAKRQGIAEPLERFGVQFVTDTCWCMLTEPVVPKETRTLITNSAKYAHYAPALVQKRVRMSSLAGCVSAARTGRAPPAPSWVQQLRRFSTASLVRPRSGASSIGATKRKLGVRLLRRVGAAMRWAR